jgi:predicted nucleic acid-binding protein
MMSQFIADTSAWIEFLRRTESAIDIEMTTAIQTGEVVLIEPVKAELLTGARSNAELRMLRRMCESFPLELVHPRDDFDVAVGLYLRCRTGGFTPRGLIDCLIGSIAQRTGYPLLHLDRDLSAVCAAGGIDQVELLA